MLREQSSRKWWLRTLSEGFVVWTELDSRILKVFIPAVANLVLLPLVGAVDLFWVGRLGDPLAIAGMGAANQVYSTIYFVISFLPAVVTPLIAKEASQGHKSKVAKLVGEALAFAFVMGLVGSLALVAFPARVLSLISSNPTVLEFAVPYLRFRGFSLIATLLSTVCFATFRGLLDFTTPLKVSLATNLINVLLDPLLMFGYSFGVAGAAAATSVAEILTCTTFIFLLRRRGFLNDLPRFPPWERVRPLLASGFAVQVRSVATNAIFLAAVRRVTTMDPTGVQAAAYQISVQFWSMGGYVLLGLSTTGSGLIPTTLWGEGGIDAARRAADRLSSWGWCLGAALGLLQLLALPLVAAFTTLEAVQRAAFLPMVFAALLQLLNGAVFAGEGVLLGLRAYRWLAASSALGCLAMLATMATYREQALVGVWLGFFAFNAVRLIGSTSHRLRFGPLARRCSTGGADVRG